MTVRLYQYRGDFGAAFNGVVFPRDYELIAVIPVDSIDDAFDFTANPNRFGDEVWIEQPGVQVFNYPVFAMHGGSVIEHDGRFWLCKSIGWDEITVLPSKVHPIRGARPAYLHGPRRNA